MRYLRGFTLLELLVAMAVFALLSVMAYAGLMQSLEAKERLLAEHQNQRSLVVAMLLLEDDLNHVRDRPIRDNGNVIQAALVGREIDTRAVAAPFLEFTRDSIAIIETEADTTPHSDLKRIDYHWDSDSGELLRGEWPVLDRAPTSEKKEMVLMTGIEDIRTLYYSNTEQHTVWPPLGQNQNTLTLPDGMEVILSIKGLGEIRRVFAFQ